MSESPSRKERIRNRYHDYIFSAGREPIPNQHALITSLTELTLRIEQLESTVSAIAQSLRTIRAGGAALGAAVAHSDLSEVERRVIESWDKEGL